MTINDRDVVHILLVEDNPTDAELAMHALKKGGLTNHIDWVKDGEEALDFLFHRGAYAGKNGLPRVVLLDLRLPKLSGIEVLREIRSSPVTQALPVVVLTSSKEERDLIEAYELGVNSFVSKPVEFKDFTDTVKELGMYWLLINQVPSSSV